MDNEEIGANLRKVRIERGFKARDVGEAMGLDQSGYSKVESGSRPLRAMELVHAAEAMGVEVTDILRARPPTVTDGERAVQSAKVAALDALGTLALQLDRLMELRAKAGEPDGPFPRYPGPALGVGIRPERRDAVLAEVRALAELLWAYWPGKAGPDVPALRLLSADELAGVGEEMGMPTDDEAEE